MSFDGGCGKLGEKTDRILVCVRGSCRLDDRVTLEGKDLGRDEDVSDGVLWRKVGEMDSDQNWVLCLWDRPGRWPEGEERVRTLLVSKGVWRLSRADVFLLSGVKCRNKRLEIGLWFTGDLRVVIGVKRPSGRATLESLGVLGSYEDDLWESRLPHLNISESMWRKERTAEEQDARMEGRTEKD